MLFAPLTDRCLLAVSGVDAKNFLQGLISNDLHKLQPDALMYAAMLTPQGKFLHDFFLFERDGKIIIDCAKSRLPDLLQRLTLYKLRAQLALEKLPETEGVIALWGNEATAVGSADPRLAGMGFRALGDIASLAAACQQQGYRETTMAEYNSHRIALGVPDGVQDMLIDKSFLLEIGFEQLHGVDFNKGCYVGQEVTARSKFRGQVRKHIYQVTAETTLPEPNTPVMFEGNDIGLLRSHVNGMGLAILRTEAVEKAQKENLPLMAGEIKITASLPIWAHTVSA